MTMFCQSNLLCCISYWISCCSFKSKTCCRTPCSVSKPKIDSDLESPRIHEILDQTEEAFFLDAALAGSIKDVDPTS